MGRYSWSRLNRQQVGRFAEYFVKMEFALHGFEIYASEVDDRGIDFVVRYGTGIFHEVQVKSVRETKYVFMRKNVFPLTANRLLALVLLPEEEAPDLYLIPASAWLKPTPLLVGRDYEDRKSGPEWGIQISHRSQRELEQYRFGTTVLNLTEVPPQPEEPRRPANKGT